MKRILLTLAVFSLAITALHAQVLPGTVPAALDPSIDPVLQAAVEAAVPPNYAGYTSLIILGILIGGRVWTALLANGGLVGIWNAVIRGKTPVKLLIACLALLTLPSCSSVLAYMASPAGQVTTAAAATLAKNLAKQGEASILRSSIDTLLKQIASYETQSAPSSVPQQFLLTAKIDGLKSAVIAAQQQYKVVTGRNYPDPSASGK